jgi:hypothetical protein
VTGENQVLLAERTAQVPRGHYNLTPYFATRAKGAEISGMWRVRDTWILPAASGP